MVSPAVDSIFRSFTSIIRVQKSIQASKAQSLSRLGVPDSLESNSCQKAAMSLATLGLYLWIITNVFQRSSIEPSASIFPSCKPE
jgi:hypothetical protein